MGCRPSGGAPAAEGAEGAEARSKWDGAPVVKKKRKQPESKSESKKKQKGKATTPDCEG